MASRPVSRLLAAAALALGGFAPCPRACGESAVRTDRVLVEGDAPLDVAEEAARLVESLWPHLAEAFGGEPAATSLPLRVRLFSDRTAFADAARAAGATEDLAASGGWTSFADGVSLVLRQPHAFDTRRLVLHEATHQFQIRLVGESARLEPAWHREGLAEHFGWHRRTSGGLVVGAMDAIARFHRPRAAAERVAQPDFDAWAIATGNRAADYTDSLAVVEGLRRAKDGDVRDLYRKWASEAVRGKAGTRRFALLLAGREEAVRQAVREAWQEMPLGWTPDLPGWDEGPEGITFEGPDVAGYLIGPYRSDAPDVAEVRVLCPPDGMAAVALGHERAEHVVESVRARFTAGEIQLTARRAPEEILARAPAPGRPGDPIVLRVALVPGGLRAEAEVPDGASAPVRLEVPWVRTGLSPWGPKRRFRLEAQGARVLFSDFPGRTSAPGQPPARAPR